MISFKYYSIHDLGLKQN